MYATSPLVLDLVALLKAHGIARIVISPGSRHYPIVRSLEADEFFDLYSVVDERSAGFFAIGLLHADSSSGVGVMTTSGTAAVNLGSATAEAYYQHLPLLLLTADRLPQLLDQMEDQMVDQSGLFSGTLRHRALLRHVRGDLDQWYNNRVLNEALLVLQQELRGPVHVNIPIASHTVGIEYSTPALPPTRVIRRHTPVTGPIDWASRARELAGRRVLVVWGQGISSDSGAAEAYANFAEAFDCCLFADHQSKVSHATRIPRPFALLTSGSSASAKLRPDVVISVGGNTFLIDQLQNLLNHHEFEHWRISPDGAIIDPYKRLTRVFQLTAAQFFESISEATTGKKSDSYATSVSRLARTVRQPDSGWGELHAIGHFLTMLPEDSALHIGNSAPIRMAHLFDLDPSITVLGNRGVNGIDGSMSAAIGFAAASNKITFLLSGDLAFFYDMNSIWIRHRPDNFRVIVVNNGGGALMHSAPLTPERAEIGARHVSAGHGASIQGWVTSMGMRYLSACNESELDRALTEFCDPNDSRPMALEVITEKISDIEQFKEYNSNISGVYTGLSPYRRARKLAGKTLKRLGLR